MRRSRSQLNIRFPCSWGGKRKRAGRKRKAKRKRVGHRTRPKLASRFPVHVNTSIKHGLPRLRGFKVAAVLRRSFVRCCKKDGFRICQFSIQGNHIHLICEANNATCLARGIQGFKVSVARRLNHLWNREGALFDDRYHEEIMKSPRQVRNGLCYVMQNARRHGEELPRWANGIDPFSSAWYFSGWEDESWHSRNGLSPPAEFSDQPGPLVQACRTWLLVEGWQIHGCIGPTEMPAAGRSYSG